MAKAEDPNAGSPWQQRAVDRSLSNARARAVSRSGQILAAARELVDETGGMDFTVQDIVDRSGLSLRSFYKHFGGKDELLLALFEELLREFVGFLRIEVEAFDDPVDRLRAYVVGFHRRAEVAGAHGGRALGTYHVRMLEVRTGEFAAALDPQIELLHEIVQQGIEAGSFRRDLDARATTALLTITLMSTAQMSVLDVHLAGLPLTSDQVWGWCAAAVGLPVDGAATSTAPGSTKTVTAARTARPNRKASAAAKAAPAPKEASPRKAGATKKVTKPADTTKASSASRVRPKPATERGSRSAS